VTTSHEAPSSADVASSVTDLSVGLGILTYTFFPFALPLILMLAVPLVLVGIVGLLAAILVVLPLWLTRSLARSWRGHTERPSHRTGLVYKVEEHA
jgi:hypothetical protein